VPRRLVKYAIAAPIAPPPQITMRAGELIAATVSALAAQFQGSAHRAGGLDFCMSLASPAPPLIAGGKLQPGLLANFSASDPLQKWQAHWRKLLFEGRLRRSRTERRVNRGHS
jgi:hypothetical protein